jgi:hypothetical protein
MMMIDLRCTQCGKRYGFKHRAGFPPRPCPKCGHPADPVSFRKDIAVIADFERLLALPLDQITPEDWRKARESAGLTLGQAEKLLGYPRRVLIALEAGPDKPDRMQALRMADVYGIRERGRDSREHKAGVGD